MQTTKHRILFIKRVSDFKYEIIFKTDQIYQLILYVKQILLLSQSQDCVPELVNRLNLDAVVTDFSPLRVPLSWLTNVKKKLPDDIPFCQVHL